MLSWGGGICVCVPKAMAKVQAPASDAGFRGSIRYDAAPPGKQVEGGMVKARLYAKKSFDLGRNTAVNLKAEVVSKQEGMAFLSYLNFPRGKIQTRSRVELSKKLLDATDTQDVRLRCGVELESGMAYAEVRENHLQLRLNSKGAWSMLYDL